MKLTYTFAVSWLMLGFAAGVGTSGQAVAQETKIRVALAQVYVSFAIAPYAKDRGIFKKNGLNVELTTYRGGGPAQEAVAAGAADAMTNGPHVAALAAAKGVKQKIVARSGAAGPVGWVLAVRKNSGINSLVDLAGRKVGVTSKGSHSDFLLQVALNSANVKAIAVPLGGGIYPAIKAGQIDAGTVWPMLSFSAAQEPEIRIIYDFGTLSGLAFDTWTFTDSFITANRPAVGLFVKSLRESLKEMKANRADTIAYLKKYLDEQDDKLVGTAFDRMIMTMPDDLSVSKAEIARTLELAKLVGVEASVTADELYTDEFTRQ